MDDLNPAVNLLNGNYIDPPMINTMLLRVILGASRHVLLLSGRHRNLWRPNAAGKARLDLDKNREALLVCQQVDLAIGRAHIAPGNHIAALGQILGGMLLAPPANVLIVAHGRPLGAQDSTQARGQRHEAGDQLQLGSRTAYQLVGSFSTTPFRHAASALAEVDSIMGGGCRALLFPGHANMRRPHRKGWAGGCQATPMDRRLRLDSRVQVMRLQPTLIRRVH